MINTLLKSHFKTLLLLLLVLGFSGCSEFLRGKPKAQEYIEIKSNGSLDCLNDVSADISSFLNSEADANVLDKTVQCLTDTLTEFQNKVEGRENANSFTADEVYDIFKTFVSAANLSREAAHNIILLKSALIGGNSARITKVEINDLKKYLVIVKEEAKKLAPYIKVFYMQKTERLYSVEFIRAAFDNLNLSLKRLLAASQLANSTYSFSDFKTMIVNVLNLQNKEQNMIEILTKVNYVLNGYQTELSDLERSMYIDSLTSFLRLYSMYVNSYAKLDFINIFELDDSINFLKEILNLLENSLQYKKTYLISVNSIDHLMLAVSNSDVLPYKLRASSLINIYKTLFVRFFEAGINGNIQNFTGIKPVNFLNFKREIAVYQIYSRLLKKMIPAQMINSGEIRYHIRELQRVMSGLSLTSEKDILNQFDTNNQYQIVKILEEMRNEFISAKPSLFQLKKLEMSVDQSNSTQSLSDLGQGLFVKMISRLIMLGYGETYQVMDLNHNSISTISMYLWYSEFKAIAIDIKGFDPRVFNGGKSFVDLANLFTKDGNGDAALTFNELYQNLGVMLTSGPIIEELYADMDLARCELPELDVYGFNWQIETCFEQVMKNGYQRYYAHLPHLLDYLRTLNDVSFKDYFHGLLNIARYSQNTAGLRIEKSDLSTLSTMLHYIESLFVSYDFDHNTKINESEIRTAYPKFKSVATEFAMTSSKELNQITGTIGDIAGFGCFSKDDIIRESFIFLAFHGRTPKIGDFNFIPCFTGKPLFYFKGEIDRRQIVEVFKSLKTILAPN